MVRRWIGYAVTIIAVACGLVTSAGAAAYASAFGSCRAQGSFATCVASGSLINPVTIAVTVTASLDQAVTVAWNDICALGASTETTQGHFTAHAPVTRVIPHAFHQPRTCSVAADAQLSNGKGDVTLTLAYSLGVSVPLAGPEIADSAGMCVDDPGNSAAPRTRIEAYGCDGGAAQQWSFTSGALMHNGLCLNDKGSGGSGSLVVLYPCTGLPNERWTHNTAGEYVLQAGGGTLCLTDPRNSTTNATNLEVATCAATPAQLWTLP
jgi:hypothetical protein